MKKKYIKKGKLTLLKQIALENKKLNSDVYDGLLSEIEDYFYFELMLTDENIESKFHNISFEDITGCIKHMMKQNERETRSTAARIGYCIVRAMDEMIIKGYSNVNYIMAKGMPGNIALVKRLSVFIKSQNYKMTNSSGELNNEDALFLSDKCDDDIEIYMENNKLKTMSRLVCKLMVLYGIKLKHISSITRGQFELKKNRLNLEYKIKILESVIKKEFYLPLPNNISSQFEEYFDHMGLKEKDPILPEYKVIQDKVRNFLTSVGMNQNVLTNYATKKLLLNDVNLDIIQAIKGVSINSQINIRKYCEQTFSKRIMELDKKIKNLKMFNHI